MVIQYEGMDTIMKKNILLFSLLACLIVACGGSPVGYRVEIYTSRNRLYLYRGFRMLADYPIATGMKGDVTINGKKYNFETPTGNFRVYRKVEQPLWTPPDWYYVTGNIPEVKDRTPEKGKLGDYALYIRSDGIMVHGTNDETSIGKYVTHGCIRMRKEDLTEVYNKLAIGSEVVIYEN